MSLGSRIKSVRIASKITQRQLAEHLGVTAQAVSQWEKGETTPSFDNLRELTFHLGVNLDWLLLEDKYPQAFINAPPNRIIAGYFTPLISTSAIGKWADLAKDKLPENTRLLEPFAAPIGTTFAIELEDESMEREFRVGDIIIADTGSAPAPGDYVIAKIDNTDEILFRKYRPRGVDEHGQPLIELAPLNSDYPTVVISSKNPGRIIAPVVEHRRFRAQMRRG